MAEIGLRERKKHQTRQQIWESARQLFEERGFEDVTVAEVARAADVSEVTVFNYFPTKEDLFFGGMQFFEERLIEAVRSRPRGESVLKAFRRALLDGADGLAARPRQDAILKAAKVVSASPSLVHRERDIVERYTKQLADLLASESNAAADDVVPIAAAVALMGAHRALVDYVRKRVLRGVRGVRLTEDYQSQARRVFARLESGLTEYDVR